MKTTRIIALSVLFAMLLSLLTGCGSAPLADPAPKQTAETTFTPYTVTDMLGREVTFDEPVERVVAISAAECEILYAIGAGDLLAARGEYCDYPQEALEVTAIASGSQTNVEQIIALQPQLIITAKMDQPKEQTEQFEQAGIKVVITDADDIEEVYTAIELIGDAVRHEQEADDLVASMKTAFADITKSAPGEDAKTIYFEVSPLEYGLWTAGEGSFMNEIAEMIGCKNCFSDVKDWAEISEEQVIERDPDYIVTITMYFGEGPTPEEEIMSRTGWDDITAVKNGKILNLSNNELSRPGPRLMDGAKLLYDFVTE